MDTQTHIEAQALEWLIRLDSGNLPAAEQAQFDAWLSTSARHHVTFLRAEAAWKRADQLKRLRPLDGSIDENLLEPPPSAWRSWLRSSPWLMAAAAASLAVVAVGMWLVVQLREWQVYATAIGSTERIVLQDGSTLNLNTDSRVRVRFTPERRYVALSRGEALFEVAHDPGRPFDVQAGDTTVRAVGTAFSVRRRERNNVEVLVTEGRVAVVSSTAIIPSGAQALPPSMPTLIAGDAATVKSGGMSVKKVPQEEIPRKLAWRDGRLWFDRERLVDAIAEFNRYNRRRLVVADPAIANLRIGGGFDATDLESFVEALERSFGIQAVSHPKEGDAEEISLFRAPIQ